MIVTILLQLLWSIGARSEPPFNNPPGVDIWCGKAYRSSDSSFDPGGQISPPTELDKIPKLDLHVYPRHNIYLSSEISGSLIFSTLVSTVQGQHYKNETWYRDDPRTKRPFTELSVSIRESSTNKVIVHEVWIPVNGTEIEVPFNPSLLTTTQKSSSVTLSVIANSPDAIQTYYSGTTVTVLPERNDTGSVARVDALYGGLEIKSPLTEKMWKSVFPYSFYTSWDWIASTINNASSPKNLTTFREQGYNIIHPIPPGGNDPFNHTLFETFMKICNELELYIMYDMRHTYTNNTAISNQLAGLQQHPSLLLYYTADEPDGWSEPLNSTSIAYEHIKSIDPYHPISVVLNCANFYFDEYTAGADIILEDTYPVAVNTSFSTVYHTECNSTYGDCGCDDCHVNDPAYAPAYTHNLFLDIIDRTENLYAYQDWLENRWTKKPIWGVPQAFWDNGSFWDRWPTAREEAVMGVLRINHGAKGLVAWSYPTSDEIEAVTSSLAKLMTSEDITRFLLGSKRVGLKTVGIEELVDATSWTRDGEVLLSVVFQGYSDVVGKVEIVLPNQVQDEIEMLWGEGGWAVVDGKLVKEGVKGLEVGILKLKVKA